MTKKNENNNQIQKKPSREEEWSKGSIKVGNN
jgi:hypothetical protein